MTRQKYQQQKSKYDQWCIVANNQRVTIGDVIASTHPSPIGPRDVDLRTVGRVRAIAGDIISAFNVGTGKAFCVMKSKAVKLDQFSLQPI